MAHQMTVLYHHPDDAADFDAHYESTHRWHVNTGNGHYGGLQFSLSTWRYYGGPNYSGNAYPHGATRAEQIQIAKRVFSPDPEEVKFAKKVIEAIPDGRGVHMIDGKMQDDATWKQCKVMVELAEMLAEKDPELAEAYGF